MREVLLNTFHSSFGVVPQQAEWRLSHTLKQSESMNYMLPESIEHIHATYMLNLMEKSVAYYFYMAYNFFIYTLAIVYNTLKCQLVLMEAPSSESHSR